MDFEAYKRAYLVEPPPVPRYRFAAGLSVTLYFQAYQDAVSYYESVLGAPGYVEGDSTTGWRIGTGWLTLLRGVSGSPTNVEIAFELETPLEAERLQAAFIEAGGSGPEPSDQLMYRPIRYCPVTDPFGTAILIVSPLGQESVK